MSTGPDRGISDEVVRVEGVEHLDGPVAHSIGSLGVLGGGIGLWATGWGEFGGAAVLVAGLVSLNGLSLYGWNRLRDAIESRDRRSVDETPDRTLSVPSLSSEHKTELILGSVQVLTLVVIVAVLIGTFRVVGVETGAYLLAGLIGVGNLGVLVLAMR